jgi:site-specific recombinase XerD
MTQRDLSPRDAVQRYLNSKRADVTQESVESYKYRLKLFVEWCQGQGLTRVSDLSGWEFDTYQNVRRGGGIAATTLQNEMKTLKNFTEYLERIELVEDGLAEKVPIPNVPDRDRSDETMLKPEDALPLLRHYRNDPEQRGTLYHALLELAWFTGARLGALRSLDLRDYFPEENYVAFKHRPRSGTGLKNGLDGERPVGFPGEVTEVLDRYTRNGRNDQHDDAGRQPLFTSEKGRPAENTIRVWFYRATFPCRQRPCPHGRVPEECDYRSHPHASKCPSSRSPHQVRTGSITWQRDLGFPPEVVAERVDSGVGVIEDYYDHQSALERLRRRRRPYIEQMSLDGDDDE